jgi:hypothetical protein
LQIYRSFLNCQEKNHFFFIIKILFLIHRMQVLHCQAFDDCLHGDRSGG